MDNSEGFEEHTSVLTRFEGRYLTYASDVSLGSPFRALGAELLSRLVETVAYVSE